jgi:predicted nucleotidyltransferase
MDAKARPMNALMYVKNPELRQALEALKNAVRDIGGERARVILYGSYARGEEREDSDVDLMAVLPDDRADFSTKDRIMDAGIDIGEQRNFFFSVFVVSESEMKRFQGFKVFDSVEKEGLPV